MGAIYCISESRRIEKDFPNHNNNCTGFGGTQFWPRLGILASHVFIERDTGSGVVDIK
jgi:hypothetical protein